MSKTAAAGGGAAPLERRLPLGTRLSRLALPASTALAVVYLFLPIVFMIAFSFNDPRWH